MKILTNTVAFAALLMLTAGSAWASHPEVRQMDAVQSLAHQVEEVARHAHLTAEQLAHHGTPREQRALAALHRLGEQAAHFHQQVETYYQEPFHTEDDFAGLVAAYDEARRTFRYLHADRHVRRDFDRLAGLMDELIGYYGGYPTYRGRSRYRGHGAYLDYRDDGRFGGRLYFRW